MSNYYPWPERFVRAHSPALIQIPAEHNGVLLVHKRGENSVDLTIGYPSDTSSRGFVESAVTISKPQAVKLIKELIAGLGLTVQVKEVIINEVDIF